MSSTAVKKGTAVIRRRTGIVREVAGFTTRPDGIKRARLVDPADGTETKVRIDQITKTYAILPELTW